MKLIDSSDSVIILKVMFLEILNFHYILITVLYKHDKS